MKPFEIHQIWYCFTEATRKIRNAAKFTPTINVYRYKIVKV